MISSPATSIQQSATSRVKRLVFNSTHGGLLGLLLALTLTFTLLIGPRFLAPDNLQSMAFQLPELGILSLAMMIAAARRGEPFADLHCKSLRPGDCAGSGNDASRR